MEQDSQARAGARRAMRRALRHAEIQLKMPKRETSLNISLATMAVSAIRNWWNSFQLDKSDANYPSTEEDEGELAEMRQLSTNLKKTLRTRQLEIDFNGGRPVLSLRAPQDLVSFPSISRPRWPIECEVISDIIHHIEWDPPEPENFYQPTGHERTPMPVGEERGKVVYCVDQGTRRPFFTCSRVGGSRGPIKSATSCDSDQTDFTLEFESRFESGNLQKAVQVGDYEYELTLCTDTYTKKHTQWFYFRVRNMEAGVTYRFTIVNLMKRSCLYSLGMRPLFYSERAAKEEGVGWQRTGSNIRYYRNCSQESNENDSDTIPLYSLTWTLRFPHDSDTCYLAHCYPYTYSHLQSYLQRVSSDPAVASYCKLRVLCHSLAGNAVYVMNITSQGDGKVKSRTKKAVVVTARVHPGETNSSWMMEGLLDFLLGDSSDAQLLRDTFVFKVVPMLNPDGVVVGNYRCSLAGRDLNRNYKTLLRDSFPCVWYIRNMVERLMAETDVALYCDFHGHNRKNNIFMYGCNNRGEGSPKLHERVFPLMMSKNANNKFSFKSCKFRVQKSKEGTGRIAMWRLGIRNSYTMEATFGGSTLGDRGGTHFTTRDLKSMGFSFCDTLLDFCDPDPSKTTYCLTELDKLLRKQAGERLGKDLGTDCNISESDLETSTSGSNSSDSDGLPAHLLNQPETVHLEFPTNCSLQKQNPVKKKKKKKSLKSRKERNQQRPERAKNDTQPQTLQESCLPPETTVKESVTERPVGRHRTKWLVNSVMKKAAMPPPDTGEVSHVTLRQGCEPVKGDGLENTRAAHSPQRPKASPHAGDLGMDTGRWRCSSQLLRLNALIPSAKPLHPIRRHSHNPGQSLMSYKLYGGLLPPLKIAHRSPSSTCVNMVPDMIQTKRLLSSFTSDNRRFIFGARGSLRVSASYSVLEDAFPSHTDASTIKRQNEEQEDETTEVGLSLWGCKPFEEQRQREMRSDIPLMETEPRSSLFGLRATNPVSGKRLRKDAKENKRQLDVSLPVSKPPDITKVKHPQRDTPCRLQDQGTTGRKNTAPQAEMVAIGSPSESPPLITPKRQGRKVHKKLWKGV